MNGEPADFFLEVHDLDLALCVAADGRLVGMEAVLLQIGQRPFAIEALEGEMAPLAAEDAGKDLHGTTHEHGGIAALGLHAECGKRLDDVFGLVGVLVVDAHVGECQALQGDYRLMADVRDYVPLLGFDQVRLDHPGTADGEDVGGLGVVGEVVEADAAGRHELELRERPGEILQHVDAAGSFGGEELQYGEVARKTLLDVAGSADAGNDGDLVFNAPVHDGRVEAGGDNVGGTGGDGLLRQFYVDDRSSSDQHFGELRGDPFDGFFRRVGSERDFCAGEAAFDQGSGKPFRLAGVVDLYYGDEADPVDFLKKIFVHETLSFSESLYGRRCPFQCKPV